MTELGEEIGSQNDWIMILKGDKKMTQFLSKPDENLSKPGSIYPIREVVKGTCKVIKQLVFDGNKNITFDGKDDILKIIKNIKEISKSAIIVHPKSKVCSIV